MGKKGKPGGKHKPSPQQGRRTPSKSSPRTPSGRFSHNDHENATFSLRDAARTERGPSSWTPNLNLRHRAVGFVRSEDPFPMDTSEQDDLDGTDEDEPEEESAPHQAHLEVLLPDQQASLAPSSPTPPLSPAMSNGSDEVVLFRGRRVLGEAITPLAAAPKHTPYIVQPFTARAVRVVEDPVGGLDGSSLNTPMRTSPARAGQIPSRQEHSKEYAQTAIVPTPNPTVVEPNLESLLRSPAGRNPRHGTNKGNRRRKKQDEDDVDDAVLDDYVANMLENDNMDGLTSGHVLTTQSSARDGWSSEDLEDFDGISTSEEVLDAVEQVLSRRQRPSGTQYLVVWAGTSVDEARWIPHASLVMDGAADVISAFEDRRRALESADAWEDEDDEDDERSALNEADGSNIEEDDNVDDDGDEDDDDDDEDDDDESEETDDQGFGDSDLDDLEDEKDLIERRLARLSDEKLARLLTKQEELGLGSDDLLIYNGMFADDGDGAGTDLELEMALAANRRHSKRRRKLGKQRRSLNGYDEAMLFGNDDNGEFDFMDRERASIAKGSRHKSDPMTWDLSDSDEAQLLHDTWAADRAKKGERKQAREELRAQGLLGKKNKFKPDLKAKYREGMDVDQLGDELRHFLFSSAESRSLPPMDKRDRKVIHEIASSFGLKSLSKGSGRSRFTTLQKTSKTIDFDSELFMRIRGRVERRFYPRMDRKHAPTKPPARRSGGGSGVVRGDFGYKHGEVVGGTAPELGADNRGRAMLEKMGWTTGNALGSVNNKGILQPIAHVVRNSRAGLG